jgi:hypothetical protein
MRRWHEMEMAIMPSEIVDVEKSWRKFLHWKSFFPLFFHNKLNTIFSFKSTLTGFCSNNYYSLNLYAKM